jgi:hypothetical protein
LKFLVSIGIGFAYPQKAPINAYTEVVLQIANEPDMKLMLETSGMSIRMVNDSLVLDMGNGGNSQEKIEKGTQELQQLREKHREFLVRVEQQTKSCILGELKNLSASMTQ